MRRLHALLTLGLLCLCACGGGGGGGGGFPDDGSTPGTGPNVAAPRFGHVFLAVLENTDRSAVIGNPAAPYINSLARTYGEALHYYGDTHPSIGNYFMLTTGQVITNSSSFSGTVTDDNLVRQLVAAGRSWKSYADALPSQGFLDIGVFGTYASRHNPVVYLSDVRSSPAQAQNVVPFTQLALDRAADALPQFGLIVPDLCNDAHDCPLSTADAWLQTHIAPLIADPAFQQDGLLILTFDEASDADPRYGGGRIVWIAVSPSLSRRGYQSARLYQHASTLRLICQALGITTYPGAAATAPDMGEFFTTP